MTLNIMSHSEAETLALAGKLIPMLRQGNVLVLSGSLGSGKTVFVRGLAQAMGHDGNLVNSPSFTIVNEYPGEKPLYHFDLYRVQDTSELYEIGWDEYLGRDGLIAIEWGEKAENLLPDSYYQVDFSIIDEHQRKIDIKHVQKND